MIVIADSGSTKTAWRLVRDGKVEQQSTGGLNPYFLGETEMEAELKKSFLSDLPSLEGIYFYGSGCHSSQMKDRMTRHFQAVVNAKHIEIHDDLLGAARASCGQEKGIVGILGTGSNSCLYNGEWIETQVDSLGFILGDEGSGSYMGKRLMADYLRNSLPEEIREKLWKRYSFDRDMILQKVYKEEQPNRFLAQFGTFLLQNRKDPYIAKLISSSLDDYFEAHITRYDGFEDMDCHLVGSIAFYFNDHIRRSATRYGVRVKNILENPIAGLTLYHSQLE